MKALEVNSSHFINKENKLKSQKFLKFTGSKPLICFLSAFLIFCLLISPACAAVSWEFSPASPVVGDTIKIKGTAAPNEEIKGEITFETDVPVSKGKYQYILEKIRVPEGFNNYFTVRAEGVKDLHVGVKKFVWVNLNAKASDGVATLSQGHVPPLSYRIVLDGNAQDGKSSVHLKFTGSQTIKADSKGKFKYSYSTSSIPAGIFKIKIGGTEQTIELNTKEKKKSVADFSATPLSGNAPLTVAFTDNSKGNPGEWNWYFGDGKASMEQNPVHTYNRPGKYTVTLKAKNNAGSDKTTKFNYIDVKKVVTVPVADFSASPTSGKTPLEVQFLDSSKGYPASWRWSFGDGSYSARKSPVHVYHKEGKYTVTLKVKNEKGTDTKIISEYIVVSKGNGNHKPRH